MITNFKSLITTITENVLNPLVGIIMALTLIYFLVGVVKYMQNVGDETKRKEGVSMMTYGVIALFVMVSVWGLVKVLQNSFSLDNTPTRPPIGDPTGLPGSPLPGPPSHLRP